MREQLTKQDVEKIQQEIEHRKLVSGKKPLRRSKKHGPMEI